MYQSADLLQEIQSMLISILDHRYQNGAPFALDASLYESGIGLDSLDTAAFSAMLEARFGTDPYTAGQFPQTVADVIRFYEETAVAGD